jgi:hypothetical protein
MALAELEFIDRKEVVHLLGPPGTGKSHLSLALGVQAVRAGRSVYFSPLTDLVSALAKAEREGTLREKIRFFCRFALLIVDEIGYLPVIPGGGNLFFQLVNARYERGAMILTSNRGFVEWGEVFGDPVVATALLDRLLHHAVVIQIEGSSYRLRTHADLVPEHIRSNALIPPPALTAAQAPRSAAQKWSHRSLNRLITNPAKVGKIAGPKLGRFRGPLTRTGERAPQLLRQSKPRNGEDFLDAFEDRAGDPGPVSFETMGEVADQLFGLIGIVQLPCLPQHAPDRSMQRFGQSLHNVAGLVDLTALDRRGVSEGSADRLG